MACYVKTNNTSISRVPDHYTNTLAYIQLLFHYTNLSIIPLTPIFMVVLQAYTLASKTLFNQKSLPLPTKKAKNDLKQTLDLWLIELRNQKNSVLNWLEVN